MSGKSRYELIQEDIILRLLKKHMSTVYSYLDIGCYTGDVTSKVANAIKAQRIYGVDIDKNALHAASGKGTLVELVDLNFDKLPYPNAYFDLITMISVIEHLTNPDNALREAHRVLRNGGYLLISTPNLANWRNRILLLEGRYPQFLTHPSESYAPSTHIRLYTLEMLRRHLETTSFKIIDVVGTSTEFEGAPKTLYYQVLMWIDIVLSKSASLACNLIVLARK